MNTRKLQRDMYEVGGDSKAQRVTLAVLAGVWVLLAWWLLGDGGIRAFGSWLGLRWLPGDVWRRMFLAACFTIYYVRLLLTEFVFLQRGVSWSEAGTIAPWLLFIFLLVGVAGGRNAAPVGVWTGAGLTLFVSGSTINTYAEYARRAWKQRPENRGRLYTGGLFRYSRHPNYCGDLMSFSGLCLISGAWATAIIPLLMLAGFVFVNIPALDSHLHDHYGRAFDEYAGHTRKLIPFLY